MKTVLYLLGNVLLMLIMGTVYSWSVFRVEVESVFGASTLESGLPYMTSLFFYALSMMVSGRFLNARNMRSLVFSGGVLITTGWFISVISSNLLMLTFGYGVIIGTGVGMVYGVPVYHINRSYESNSGLYTGIVLGGFGASPLVTAPLISMMIRMRGLTDTFFVMGVVSIMTLIPLSLIFRKKGLENKKEAVASKVYDKKLFWKVYMLFLTATSIGLMIIGLTYRIGVSDYAFNTTHVALSVSVFALLNGISRPIFGHLMDAWGFVRSVTLSTGMILFAAVMAMVNHGESLMIYAVSFGLFWLNLGAWLAMVPAAIKEYFGIEGYARRYGVAFTAYGVGAIIGTVMSGVLLDLLDDTRYVYGMILTLTFLMGFIIRSLTNNEKQEAKKKPVRVQALSGQ